MLPSPEHIALFLHPTENKPLIDKYERNRNPPPYDSAVTIHLSPNSSRSPKPIQTCTNYIHAIPCIKVLRSFFKSDRLPRLPASPPSTTAEIFFVKGAELDGFKKVPLGDRPA